MGLIRKSGGTRSMFLLGAVFFVGFGFLLPWSFWIQWRVAQMLTWPTTEAEIIATDTTASYTRNQGMHYQHALTYRFTVAGKSHTGNRVTYGGSPPEWRTEAEARRALPAVGSKTQIRYNPRDPDDAVVQAIPMPKADATLLQCVTGVLALAGGGLMVAAGRAWRRGQR